MNNKKTIIFIGLIVGAMIGFYVFDKKFNNKKFITISGHKIELEVARSAEQRKIGLGGREELCCDCGMLFKFPEKGQYGFWMKDMKFSLDMIWISDNKIVHLEKNVKSDFKGTLDPKVQADMVLEINAGKSDELGLGIGMEIM